VSVYSPITRSQLEALFDDYDLGKVINFEGITAGIDNTNYQVTTSSGEFVLTVFESLTDSELKPVFRLLAQANKHVPCPLPQPKRNDNLLSHFNNKPAAVFNFLPGVDVKEPSTEHCRTLGSALGKLHIGLKEVEMPMTHRYNLSAFKTVFKRLKSHLSASDIVLIEDELSYQSRYNFADLPGSVIHGDLFRDNVLYIGDKLSGILDFYDACKGPWLIDIAIATNDWCSDNGSIHNDKTTSLLAGYQSIRPLQSEEQRLWPVVLRAAALRFWLSRLQHRIQPRPGVLTQEKDPNEFKRLLQQHRQLQSRSAPVSTHLNPLNLRKSA